VKGNPAAARRLGPQEACAALCRPADPGSAEPRDYEAMKDSAEEASRLLKALANQDRLMILCNLAEGERCVSELERILKLRQPSLSQQLARLRADRLVETRRDGKVIYYRLASSSAARVIDLLYDIFCRESRPTPLAPAQRAARSR